MNQENIFNSLAPFLQCSAEDLRHIQMNEEAKRAFSQFLTALECGAIRTAARDSQGKWHVDTRVKQAILFGFRLGQIIPMGDGALPLYDKDTFPVQQFSLERKIRIVPGGSAVRRGAFIGSSVTIMPPAYVNVGAYIDDGTLVDSHALVGSCAQVGKRVHLSAAAQLGGVLEPIGAMSVIIEDDVFIGGNCGIFEGTLVRSRAVIGAGVILTSSTKVFDLVHERTIVATAGQPLEIPQGAVVVPGARAIAGTFAEKHGLQIATPIIVKYRDEKTDVKAALESALR